MFSKKPLKAFHISTAHFYLLGEKEVPSRLATALRPFITRPGYRSRSSGNLVAL